MSVRKKSSLTLSGSLPEVGGSLPGMLYRGTASDFAFCPAQTWLGRRASRVVFKYGAARVRLGNGRFRLSLTFPQDPKALPEAVARAFDETYAAVSYLSDLMSDMGELRRISSKQTRERKEGAA